MTDEHSNTPADGETGHQKLTPMRAPWEPEPDPGGPAVVEQPTTTGPVEHPLTFNGTAGEYFRIWIVNVGLTLVTLGIYAAWAKVRTKRYFYANTTLDGAPFDYLANPIAILKGNLIGVAVLALWSLANAINPLVAGAFWLVFLVALPWIVVRSLKFRTANTTWRNIRFGFDGTYGQAAYAYLFAPFTTLLLGITVPWADWIRRRLLFRGARFGTTQFEIDDLTSKFYGIYVKLSLSIFAIVLIIGLAGTLAASIFLPPGVPADPTTAAVVAVMANILPIPLGLATLALVSAYLRARITNVMWNHTRLGEHAFRCHIGVKRLAWIYIGNTVAIICTLGLAIPWARVRTVQYQLDCMTVVAASDLAAFAAEARDAEPMRAIGEEVGEALGLDIGL